MKKLLFVFFLLMGINVSAQSPHKSRFDSLTAVYEKAGYHGVILVARGNKVLYEKGYGYANFEQKIPNVPTTVFKTESVGKMFTATAIMQLVEAKKLKLSQTIKELLPELKIATADKITIDHLLKHTSGLQSPWDHPDWNVKKIYAKAELVKIVEEVPLAFDVPGKEWYYSNSGYVILGWIIEKVTGEPFDQYFNEKFFAPLSMKATRHLNDTVMPLLGGAQPYRVINSKKFIPLTTTVGPKAIGAGGWISTAKDLYRFMYALNTGKLIKPATLNMMQTANGKAPKDSVFRFYAYGLETYVNEIIPTTKIYGHNGGGAGFSIDAFVEAVSGYTIISCTNLYQNSRYITMNYLKLALDKVLDPVSVPFGIQVYDLIDSVGIDNFVQNEKDYFKQLKAQLRPDVFAEINDAMQLAGDNKVCSKWMELARKYYPNEAYLWILSGDNEVALGSKAIARKMFEKAKEIGKKEGDKMAENAAAEKIKSLLQ